MRITPFDLSGRVAIVTGAGSGIGQAVACGLANAGADVALTYRTDANQTASQIQAIGRTARTYACDFSVAGASEFSQLVKEVLREFGRIDILVNNAGSITVAPALDLSQVEWQAELQVNLTSAFLMSQAVAHGFGGAPGVIINIGSVLSFQGSSSVVAYTAAKSGLAGMTRALAVEWAALGIRVNAVAPGYVRTAMVRRLEEDDNLRAPIDARIPIGRWAEPADIAAPVTFLASDAAAYVTGVVLPVDGGWLAG
ncbi:MAG: SDR family oxidoreductase [Actinomycetota bacterium]|nr:SDR family oxidoreductase [Actinomycetota bacterium]